jgi:nitrite reductase/ring-hydroxylating ferredoxin subunit
MSEPQRFEDGGREPLWREEFSVREADERYVSRRQLGKFLVLTSLGMFVGNLWILLRSLLHKRPVYPAQAVARVDELAVGAVKLFRYPTADDPCLLVRTAESEWRAFSQVCTHLSCAVVYVRAASATGARGEGRLECPCHNGAFSVRDGRVLQGPPPRPLPRVRLEVRGEVLVAVGMVETEET